MKMRFLKTYKTEFVPDNLFSGTYRKRRTVSTVLQYWDDEFKMWQDVPTIVEDLDEKENN